MRFFIFSTVFFFSMAGAPSKLAAEQRETPHLAFVTEYLRQLAATEDVRAVAEKELATAKDNNERLLDGVHGCALVQLELQSQIKMLKGMKLNEPFEELIPNIIGFYRDKIALHQQLIDISTELLTGPKSGVDYGKLAAETPKIRAKLDHIDKALFEASPMIFATLINLKPDSHNHANHLIITKAQKAKLIDDVTGNFGEKLGGKDQKFIVGAASVLKSYFLKDGFKCSDELWQ